MVYKFEAWEVDPARRELRRANVLQRCEPQVFDLLTYLVQNPSRVISKDELISKVWHGRIVSDSTLNSRINAARRAIGDDGRAQRFIRTSRSKGFRFVGVCEDETEAVTAAASPTTGTSWTPAPRHWPALIVLPFANMHCDPELECFADGLTEDIITAIVKSQGCHVVSRNASFSYKNKTIDAKAVAREQSARYVLEGSVRRVKGCLRISARVIDGQNNYHVWVNRVDCNIASGSANYDEVVYRLAREVNLGLLNAEYHGKYGNEISPDYMVVRGWSLLHRAVNEGNTKLAINMFEAATHAGANSSHALIGLACALGRRVINVWSTHGRKEIHVAEDLLRRVAAMGPDRADAHYARGLIYRAQNEPELSINEYKAAIGLNGGLAPAFAQIGQSYMRLGRSEKTFGFVEKAFRRGPQDPNRAIWLFITGSAHLYLGQYDNAARVLRCAILADPEYPTSYALLAAAHALIGDRQASHRALEKLQLISPGYTIKTYKNFAHGDHPVFLKQVSRTCDGLHRAGLAEK